MLRRLLHNRRRVLWALLVFLSAQFFILTAFLWVQSYRAYDSWNYVSGDVATFRLYSLRGSVNILCGRIHLTTLTLDGSLAAGWNHSQIPTSTAPTLPMFALEHLRNPESEELYNVWYVRFPFWLLAIPSAIPTAILICSIIRHGHDIRARGFEVITKST